MQEQNEKDWLSEQLDREKKVSVDTSFDEENKPEKKKVKKENDTSDPFFVIDLILFSLMIPAFVGMSGHPLYPLLPFFIFLGPGTILWEIQLKKFPPRWYFILALVLTIIAEAIVIIQL